MTPDERNLLLHGFFSRPNPVNKLPQIGAPYAAGYTPGIARLGIDVDPRLLADWSAPRRRWAVPAGRYDVTVNTSAAAPVLDGATGLEARLLPP